MIWKAIGTPFSSCGRTMGIRAANESETFVKRSKCSRDDSKGY